MYKKAMYSKERRFLKDYGDIQQYLVIAGTLARDNWF
jgi:hypothetical protein